MKLQELLSVPSNTWVMPSLVPRIPKDTVTGLSFFGCIELDYNRSVNPLSLTLLPQNIQKYTFRFEVKHF